jgi:divalent metal cation (Fe/Co/Zn/Cd) transporter
MIDEIAGAPGQVEGVLGVHDVRARWVGRELVVTMHIDCDPDSTLGAAHDTVLRVEHAVRHAVPAARMEIHMDPGRPSTATPWSGPATRKPRRRNTLQKSTSGRSSPVTVGPP